MKMMERIRQADDQTNLTTKNRCRVRCIIWKETTENLAGRFPKQTNHNAKEQHGAAIQMLSFNEAKKLLAAESKLFESDAELEKALWNGMKLKDGGSLRDSYFTPTGI